MFVMNLQIMKNVPLIKVCYFKMCSESKLIFLFYQVIAVAQAVMIFVWIAFACMTGLN